MKLLSLMLALATAKVVLSAGCNANNCARAVTGTRIGAMPVVTSRMEDCSSYMLATVIPATSTATAHSSITDTIDLFGMKKRLQRRQVTVVPSSIPSYASACSTPGAYASACSCWGITAATTTAPSPVTTTTVTTTVATVSVCPAPYYMCGNSCIDPDTDVNNCGFCGNKCIATGSAAGGGISCHSGLCFCLQTDSFACDTGDTCPNTLSDTSNCGYCGNQCPSGAICVGECSCATGLQPICNGACPDFDSDPNNCGTCENKCSENDFCEDGDCVPGP